MKEHLECSFLDYVVIIVGSGKQCRDETHVVTAARLLNVVFECSIILPLVLLGDVVEIDLNSQLIVPDLILFEDQRGQFLTLDSHRI